MISKESSKEDLQKLLSVIIDFKKKPKINR